MWKVDVEMGESVVANSRVSHEMTWRAVLKACVEGMTEATLKHEARDHIAAIQSGKSLKLVMKRVPCAANAQAFFALDLDATIRATLRGKTVIEYPAVRVLTPEEHGRYPSGIQEILEL